MTTDRDEQNDRHLLLVITFTNLIETRMKHVIASFSKIPTGRLDFFHSHIANNATISFGAKVKLIFAIAKVIGVRVDRNAFHVLLSRRNAFAHQDPVTSIRLGENPQGEPNVAYVVESLKGTGEMETITRKQAYLEFMRAHMTAQHDINAMLKAIESHNGAA